jgi:surface polysaccharide O-acyltransferase-like enzyme
MALCVRLAQKPRKIFDSLRTNAYGMYLVHCMFVSWLQFGFLKANLPGIAKGVMVTVAAALLSWGFTAMLRRIPAVARVI